MRRLAPTFLALVALACALPARGEAQLRDPTLEWRTIETEHFDIHYHDPLALVARRVAAVAERAHGTLRVVFGFEPTPTPGQQRIQIVLTDDSDSANGSATALPFDTIRLYAEPPEDLSTLGDYDDWLTTLVSHEHTHILHLDQASGLPSILNAILGKVYMPNHVLPRWMIEGIAVWQETERTSGGRLRSSMWDMYLRADVLEGRTWGIDQLSTTADRWPHGEAQYLYGSYLMSYIAGTYGRESIAQMAQDYGGSILPYGINRVAERATGRTFTQLYEDFLAERRAHYQAMQDEVDALGRIEGVRITTHGESTRAPRYLRDGRLLYLRADNGSRSRLMIVDPATGQTRDTLARLNAGGEGAVHPDGRTVTFSRVDFYRDIYAYADLFRRDLETGEETRLTNGLRAREPDLSPDGRHLVFTTTRAGTSHLMLADVEDVSGTMRELAPHDRFELVYTPRFSPDGRSIVFAAWSSGGYRDIHVVDVETGRVDELTHDRAQDSGPVFSPDGSVVYFSSDRTGIANIYAYRLATGTTRQITNVVMGAYSPAVSPDGSTLVYLGYTSYGFDLFRLDGLDPNGFREAPVYRDTRPAGSDTEALFFAESRDYDPLPTLYPRSYMLDLAQDAFGPQLGITTQGSDVVGQHTYSIRLGFGLVRGNLQVDAGYAYQRSPLGVTVTGFRYLTQAGGLEIAGLDRTWIQDQAGGTLGLSYAFPRSFRYDAIALSYAGTYTSRAEPWPYEIDPNTPPPRSPYLGYFSTLRLGWTYSDVERYLYDISPSNGRTISLGVGLADPLFGSSYRSVTFTWSVTQYIPLWEHHVLAMRYGGGISGGDLDRRGAYGVGGYPNVSPISGLYDPNVLGGVVLRGYPTNVRVGTQMHLAQLEYRLPIVRFNQGALTLPVFLNRMYATVFADYGNAFSDAFDLGHFLLGVGGEVLIDFTLFYLIQLTFRVGYARGVMEGGTDQFYGHLGVPF
ncbi:MAG: hypothetical protein U0234_00215 [Sandaracinus sp.]